MFVVGSNTRVAVGHLSHSSRHTQVPVPATIAFKLCAAPVIPTKVRAAKIVKIFII